MKRAKGSAFVNLRNDGNFGIGGMDHSSRRAQDDHISRNHSLGYQPFLTSKIGVVRDQTGSRNVLKVFLNRAGISFTSESNAWVDWIAGGAGAAERVPPAHRSPRCPAGAPPTVPYISTFISVYLSVYLSVYYYF